MGTVYIEQCFHLWSDLQLEVSKIWPGKDCPCAHGGCTMHVGVFAGYFAWYFAAKDFSLFLNRHNYILQNITMTSLHPECLKPISYWCRQIDLLDTRNTTQIWPQNKHSRTFRLFPSVSQSTCAMHHVDTCMETGFYVHFQLSNIHSDIFSLAHVIGYSYHTDTRSSKATDTEFVVPV